MRASRWWWTAGAWLLFITGLTALGLLDYALRLRDGVVGDGGVGEIQYPLIGMLGVVALTLAWRGTGRLRLGWRVVVIAVEAAIGVAVYAFAAIAYVCGSGIDCF